MFRSFEIEIFTGSRISEFCARRIVMMTSNLVKTLAKPLVMAKNEHGIFVMFKKPAKLLSSYLPVSPSRVLPCTRHSTYHLVAKHLRTTWSRPEQSHLPEACFPNGTDKRRQRQRQMERPPPEPSDILKRYRAS